MVFSFRISIYFLVISMIYYLYNTIKNFKINSKLNTTRVLFYFNLIFFVAFFGFFVIFLRFLNLFRQRSAIDIQIIFHKLLEYDLFFVLLSLITFFLAVKYLVFLFKLSFLKIHYYLMNPVNFFYNEQYKSIIYFFVTWPNRLILFFIYNDINIFQIYREFFYYFFRYFFSLIMFLALFFDLNYNGFHLVFFTKMLPWYSLYQLLYNLNSFLYYDLEYLYDVIITDILYPFDYDREYRLYHEYSEHKSCFRPNKPEGYLLENDEYLIIRNYITKRLLS